MSGKQAISFSDGLKHWHKIQSNASHWTPFQKQSISFDIEMTSYALLIHAANDDVAGGMPIMKWITGQINSNRLTQVLCYRLRI